MSGLRLAFLALWVGVLSHGVQSQSNHSHVVAWKATPSVTVATPHGHRGRENTYWNEAFDVLVRHAKRQITIQEKSRVDLRDIDERFNKKVKFIVLRGFFRATGGWLEDYSSLHRIGDVSFKSEGSAVLMTAVMGLGDFRLGYNRYEGELWNRSFNGSLNGTVGRNEIQFVMKFDLVDGQCRTSLVNVTVLKLENFRLTVTGVGPFDFIVEKILQWLLEKKTDAIKGSIQRQLSDEIVEALEDFNCDEYATLAMLPF